MFGLALPCLPPFYSLCSGVSVSSWILWWQGNLDQHYIYVCNLLAGHSGYVSAEMPALVYPVTSVTTINHSCQELIILGSSPQELAPLLLIVKLAHLPLACDLQVPAWPRKTPITKLPGLTYISCQTYS